MSLYQPRSSIAQQQLINTSYLTECSAIFLLNVFISLYYFLVPECISYRIKQMRNTFDCVSMRNTFCLVIFYVSAALLCFTNIIKRCDYMYLNNRYTRLSIEKTFYDIAKDKPCHSCYRHLRNYFIWFDVVS